MLLVYFPSHATNLFSIATGNFPTVTRVLLAKIPAQDGQMTYQYDQYNFQYIVEGGVCFLCMSDELNKHRIPYAFLNDMKTRFVAQYGREDPLQAIAFSYNEEFSPVIEERMNFYNSEDADKAIDNIGAVKSQIEDVKNVMVQNIEKVRVFVLLERMNEGFTRQGVYVYPKYWIAHLVCSIEKCRSSSAEKRLNY